VSRASAQEDRPSAGVELLKHVAFDPTTYAPAALGYYSMVRDWNTSQPLFEHGANEMNPRYTVTGRSNDAPLSYSAGHRQILKDALFNLEVSAASNATSYIVERMLTERYPTHRKLFHALGWVQRISLSAALSYQLSIQHFRQTDLNEQMAQRSGF
jgi:hypothetical protein